MNKVEHLLTCLVEECAEVQQAVCKAQRFGLDDGYPGSVTTNAQDIVKECTELIAVVEMLQEEGVITGVGLFSSKYEKKERVKQYMKYAESRGMLEN